MRFSKIYKALFVFAFLLTIAQGAEARSVWLSHPEGAWANVIIESTRSRTRDEALCQSGDALRFYDALKLRAEAGADSAVKEFRLPGLRLKCENVTGMGFVSCSLQFTPTAHIVIDASNKSLRATWTGPEAQSFLTVWDHECAGQEFQTEDRKFSILNSHNKVEILFQTP